MEVTRRSFVAALVAALSGLRLARRREIVVGNGEPIEVGPGSWETVRLNGRPVRLLRSRKLPPSTLVEARDGRVWAASGMSNDEIATRLREWQHNVHYWAGQQWVTRASLGEFASRREFADRVHHVRNLFR